MKQEISTAWLHGLEGDRREDFKKLLRNNTQLFNQMRLLIQNRLGALDTKEMAEEDFKSPEWATRQAYRIGRRTELRALLDLLP